MHSKGDNTEIVINDEADKVKEELFKLLKNRHQNNLESMKGSEFAYDYDHLLYYKSYKINPNQDGSYIDSLEWIKTKNQQWILSIKKIINAFKIAVTVTLVNHVEIGKISQKLTKIKPFINKYKWEWISVPSEKDDCKKTEKNNVTIALNILHAEKEKNIFCLYFKT